MPAIRSLPPTLNTREVAKLLHTSIRNLRRMIRCGAFPRPTGPGHYGLWVTANVLRHLGADTKAVSS